MPETRSASEIAVARFRQIFHLPLIWDGAGEFDLKYLEKGLSKGDWRTPSPTSEKAGKRFYLDDEPGGEAHYNEYVYFHDFLREFLYPDADSDDQVLLTWAKTMPAGRVGFSNNCGSHRFDATRLWLRAFKTGIAILTVEVNWATAEDDGTTLTLAQVQTIIDHFRRIYTPFWIGNTPARVPVELDVAGVGDLVPQQPDQMAEGISQRYARGGNEGAGRHHDPALLEPWKTWVAGLAPKNWRIPSDERVPVMSYIALAPTGSARDTLRRISEGDWYRLAEADEAGAAKFEYNPDFLRLRAPELFYDRFFPHEDMYDYIATRHIFGGAHYALVTVHSDFAETVLQMHFRRHYEKMALIARFEQASLLAFSSRITRLVRQPQDRLSADGGKAFRESILKIRDAFLDFTHRYRFTGVSSQIQGAEMYAHWRKSLDLDALYEDVKDEIASAADFSLASIDKEQTERANALTTFGTLLAALLAPASILSLPFYGDFTCWLGARLGLGAQATSIWLPLGSFLVLALVVWLLVRWRLRKP